MSYSGKAKTIIATINQFINTIDYSNTVDLVALKRFLLKIKNKWITSPPAPNRRRMSCPW